MSNFSLPAAMSKASPRWKNGASTLPCSIRRGPTSPERNSASPNWPISVRNSNMPRRLSSLAKASYERSAKPFSQFAKASDRGNSPGEDGSRVCDQSVGENAQINRSRDPRGNLPVFSALYEKAPYPAVKESSRYWMKLLCRIPKAKNYKPEDFVDTSIMRQLDQSGFIGSVYR